ncbi:hypothetical protein ADUPG1_006177 [Aduncisulcus paluster]|uniref:Protein kinase domain-containing protein n=1 Tax=Aduncisulcus paluster TaxID=2918883 RepID=A0ABQ5KLM6_9EUKA|nr:hypothetical protein ADUPG1_006177 [Aduncisulcus paluster]
MAWCGKKVEIIVKPDMVRAGNEDCVPIPRIDPTIHSPDFPCIMAKDETKKFCSFGFDQSSDARKMMKGESISGKFTNISIPFTSPVPIKGAYICIDNYMSPITRIVLTFTSSKKKKKSLTCEFHGKNWYLLPIDLYNVVLCEISRRKGEDRAFRIISLVFFREETPDESFEREFKKQECDDRWDTAPIVTAKFITSGGRYSVPFPRDDPGILPPSMSLIEARDYSKSRESKWFDQSFESQNMLKGDAIVSLSYLSIPFESANPVKGAYICVDESYSSPSLLFTFTHADGSKTSRKYVFLRPAHKNEWYFLPIDSYDITSCEIEGKGIFKEKNSRCFWIYSLVFIRGEDIPFTKPEFICDGDHSCIPIPRDAPIMIRPAFPVLKARNETFSRSLKEYDRRNEAIQMLKGGWNRGLFTHISLSFSSCTPMKGAYICISHVSSPSYLLFTFFSSKRERSIKKYIFPRLDKFTWFLLPIDLPDVLSCEIMGKGEKDPDFNIVSLAFVREETPEETLARKRKEKIWTQAPIMKRKRKSSGERSILPIEDEPMIFTSLLFSMVEAKNDSFCKDHRGFCQSIPARKMLKRECSLSISHLYVPFTTLCPLKCAYICLNKHYSSPSLLFTFTHSDETKTFMKCEFPVLEFDHEWHFLLIDLDNVVSCEIEGKGRWDQKNSRWFDIESILFVRGYDISHVLPEYVFKGDYSCVPIPRDDPTMLNPLYSHITAINDTLKNVDTKSIPTIQAQKMMKGEYNIGTFTPNIHTICFSLEYKRSIYLFRKCSMFRTTFSIEGRMIIDISDSPYKYSHVYEEIDYQRFSIQHLAFVRTETPHESRIHRQKELSWVQAERIDAEFKKVGYLDSIPISRDSPSCVNPKFSSVKARTDSCCREASRYDKSFDAQQMLKGKGVAILSHLSIPFPAHDFIIGAYICIDKNYSSPSLLFTFTHADGKKTAKKYDFVRPEHPGSWNEWYFLPVKLYSVILCEIEGNGRWEEENSRWFKIDSLMFIRDEDIPILEVQEIPPQLVPSSLPTAIQKEEEEAIVGIPITHDEQVESKFEGHPKESDEVTIMDIIKPKLNPQQGLETLTSASIITPLCILGHGEFGEVLLVSVAGYSYPCVLKKILKKADKKLVKECCDEFTSHLRWIHRLPRPLYILNLLDESMKGMFGVLTEYCIGGSVMDFARSWCADGDFVIVKDNVPKKNEASGGDSSRACGESSIIHDEALPLDPETLNPMKVCALCVGMIECLDDIFKARPGLVHRNIKPDNFLIRDYVSAAPTSKKFGGSSCSSDEKPPEPQFEDFVYNSYEALRGFYSQKGDAYSLGISILALFLCCDPFLQMPMLKGIENSKEFIRELILIIKENMGPKLTETDLFKSLIPPRRKIKFKSLISLRRKEEFQAFLPLRRKNKRIYKCLNEVFTGLTELDVEKRMTVHQACVKVQSIKRFLPKIGEGWYCPRVEDTIYEQCKKYGGYTGTIEDNVTSEEEKKEEKADQKE